MRAIERKPCKADQMILDNQISIRQWKIPNPYDLYRIGLMARPAGWHAKLRLRILSGISPVFGLKFLSLARKNRISGKRPIAAWKFEQDERGGIPQLKEILAADWNQTDPSAIRLYSHADRSGK